MSRWALAKDIYSMPAGPGAYAVYLRDELMYVGSTVNLNSRFFLHQQIRSKIGALLTESLPDVRIKYRRPAKYGDWAMVELRLIARLQPPLNHRSMKRAVERPIKRRRRMEVGR